MDARSANLVATMGTALGDAVTEAVTQASGLAGAAAAGLAILLAEPGLGVDGFARAAGLTGSGAVRLVDRLAQAGLVERRAGRDARAVSLWLTHKGRRVAGTVLRAREAVVSQMLVALNRNEQATLTRLSEKILTAVTEDRVHAEWLCRLCDTNACQPAHCPVERAVL
jgi:DNA-binding MarR family transcriptional regulator